MADDAARSGEVPEDNGMVVEVAFEDERSAVRKNQWSHNADTEVVIGRVDRGAIWDRMAWGQGSVRSE